MSQPEQEQYYSCQDEEWIRVFGVHRHHPNPPACRTLVARRQNRHHALPTKGAAWPNSDRSGKSQPRRSGRQPIHPPHRLGLQGDAARILPAARCLISIRPCPCEISPMPSPFHAARLTVLVSIILARRGRVTKLRGGCVNRLRKPGPLRNKVENSGANRASQKKGDRTAWSDPHKASPVRSWRVCYLP